MTQQEKLDYELIITQLWDALGVDLIDKIALRALTASSNNCHLGNEFQALSYRSIGLGLQALHAKAQYDLMLLDYFPSEV